MAAHVTGSKVPQRDLTERLLLGALREQEVARQAVSASDQAHYLARISRELSMSLDEDASHEAVRRLALPRMGTWCIVDVIEANGAIRRLSVAHPDPDKQALARSLEPDGPDTRRSRADKGSLLRKHPTVVTHESGAALMLAAHGEANLRILRQIGFGSLLVVPLLVRARVQGAITFLSPEGDPPFTTEEIALAVDVAARSAMALDNARLYREADGLRRAAESANQSKSEFLGSMSHELRTPLNAIGGFTELLEMGVHGPVTGEQLMALGRIRANQKHLLTLITDMLNFVRVESGRMEYNMSAVSVPKVLTDVSEMLLGTMNEKAITLDWRDGSTGVMAWADPDRVRQILVNIVMNAVKYANPRGGTITLSCEARGDTVYAHVADTGPGIPGERLESIFQPFVQLSSGIADRRGGVGLGLAISRDLARAMNGDLYADSTVGVGSRFTLALPLAPPESDGRHSTETHA